MPIHHAVSGQAIDYHGTRYTLGQVTTNDDGTISVELNPPNETIENAVRTAIQSDPHGTLDFDEVAGLLSDAE